MASTWRAAMRSPGARSQSPASTFREVFSQGAPRCGHSALNDARVPTTVLPDPLPLAASVADGVPCYGCHRRPVPGGFRLWRSISKVASRITRPLRQGPWGVIRFRRSDHPLAGFSRSPSLQPGTHRHDPCWRVKVARSVRWRRVGIHRLVDVIRHSDAASTRPRRRDGPRVSDRLTRMRC